MKIVEKLGQQKIRVITVVIGVKSLVQPIKVHIVFFFKK